MHVMVSTTIVLLATGAVVTGVRRAGPVEPVPLVSMAMDPVLRADGSRGCDITLSATNTGTQNLKLKSTSQVRAKPAISPAWGTWKRLWGSDQTVAAGRSWSDVVRLDFGCNYVRQYRFRMVYGGNEKGFVFPSSGTTKLTSISMGNLYTKFFD